jgi:ABC-type phosphate transport system substrate-binding protein
MIGKAGIVVLLVVLLLTLTAADLAGDRANTPVFAEGEHIAVIVNRANSINGLSMRELRRIFLCERTSWQSGRKITVVMRDPGQVERDAILRLVYRMTEGEYQRHFLQARFTGEVIVPPRVVSSPAGVRKFVAYVPGAIGYVRACDLDDTVKFLLIDGEAPGNTDYKLKLPAK